jgi:hypothetical protein
MNPKWQRCGGLFNVGRAKLLSEFVLKKITPTQTANRGYDL